MTEKARPRAPEGQRFSHVYLDRGEPVGESGRMRVRMRTLWLSIERLRGSKLMGAELGVKFHSWADFFDRASMRDILDAVTVGYNHLLDRSFHSTYDADNWLNGVQRIFSEENIHYQVDREGGVHFQYDREFTHTTAAAISVLEPVRYANSLDAFNKALAALAEAPPDGKGAIRATFTAIEGLFILMFPEVKRLAAGEHRVYDPRSSRFITATGALKKPVAKCFNLLATGLTPLTAIDTRRANQTRWRSRP